MLKKDTQIKKTENETATKGITLIALVVTIIVLLILVGISIPMLSGQNRNFNKSSDRKGKYRENS